MGAANPVAAAEKTAAVACALGLHQLKVAAVTGDDVLDTLREGGYRLDDTGRLSPPSATGSSRPMPILGPRLVEALAAGAEHGHNGPGRRSFDVSGCPDP